MAKLTFRDVLTKISNVFKTDMYVIQNQFCIGGPESEDNNQATIICILTNECMELMKEQFPDNDIVYISDIKKCKDNIEEYSKTDILSNIKKESIERKNGIMKVVNSISTWNNFEFDTDTVESIFSEGGTIELFTEDKNIPSLTIGKSLFPMVTGKTVSNLYYSTIVPKEEDQLITFVTSFDTDWFQIYGIIQYINLE